MIYTSNFARNWNHPNAVGISKTVPPWGIPQRRCESLAPSHLLINDIKQLRISKEEYTERYHEEVLSKLDPKEIFEELGEGAVLLCWEGPDKFCHRHIVGKWLSDAIGIDVEELE
jgi:hypothetical protein